MKALKSLTLAITMAVSGVALAETQSVTDMANTAVEKAKTEVVKQVTPATQATQTAPVSTPTAKEILNKAAEQKATETAKKSAEKANVNGKININTANAKELKALDGIGAAKAKAIIKYRKKVGTIKSVDELSNVKGIGKATAEKIAPYLTF